MATVQVAFWVVAMLVAIAIAFDFMNGVHDAANAIATVISTGVMTPRQAIVMAVIMNTLGAAAGTAVAATVGKGIVAPSALTVPSITATMVSIIIWGSLAARLGIPVSKSHALLAGLAGAGFAGGGSFGGLGKAIGVAIGSAGKALSETAASHSLAPQRSRSPPASAGVTPPRGPPPRGRGAGGRCGMLVVRHPAPAARPPTPKASRRRSRRAGRGGPSRC